MTLHPIPLNFLIYEERFIFFFISVGEKSKLPVQRNDFKYRNAVI